VVDALHLVSNVPTGPHPLSVTVNRGLVYVLNGGTTNGTGVTPSITGYRLSADGALTPIPGSTRPVAGGPISGATQVSFNPAGTVLIITEKQSNPISSYTVDAAGVANAPIANQNSGGSVGPFGFTFTRLYRTRHSTPGRDWFRVQKPVPTDPLWTAKQDSISLPRSIGLPGLRHSIGLARWWHLGTDTLWLANGLVFYALLFSTGQWRRVVPTRWEVFPSALSVLIQYLSLDWPLENGWAAYNSLQLLAYFITVFVAAPLALLTGLGMSPALSTRCKRISKVLSIQTARSLHFLVMIWFLTFLLLHVTFVATTGLLRNLNHIYLANNDRGWVGFVLFSLSMMVLTAGWVAATPFTLRHPRTVQKVGYALIGSAQRLFEHLDATPGEYSEADISPYFWHNGQYPDSPAYEELRAGGFADYRLRINGLVAHPCELTLTELRALPVQEQITQHFCIQGWSGIAKWRGVAMQTVLDLARPTSDARWVIFYSLGDAPDGGIYYDAHPIEQMSHHLAMLAYDMNDEPLTFGHGAPLRLRNESQLGFKQVKWVKGVEFVAHFSQIGGGHGGYNPDHEFFGYRQTL